MMEMSAQEFDRFQRAFFDWEATLTRILPRSLERGDPDIGEEVAHLFDSRSGFEEDFASYSDEERLVPFRIRVVPLDVELLLRRDALLANWSLSEYRSWRTRNDIPRSHWWWYLDEQPEEVAAAAIHLNEVSRLLATSATPR